MAKAQGESLKVGFNGSLKLDSSANSMFLPKLEKRACRLMRRGFSAYTLQSALYTETPCYCMLFSLPIFIATIFHSTLNRQFFKPKPDNSCIYSSSPFSRRVVVARQQT
jgi:hypothetical protein